MHVAVKRYVVIPVLCYCLLFGPIMGVVGFFDYCGLVPNYVHKFIQLCFFPHLIVAYFCKPYWQYINLWMRLWGLYYVLEKVGVLKNAPPPFTYTEFTSYLCQAFPAWGRIILYLHEH